MRQNGLNVVKAMRSLSETSTLTDEQKALLLLYFCDNPVVAGTLPDNVLVRERFFQDHLRRLEAA